MPRYRAEYVSSTGQVVDADQFEMSDATGAKTFAQGRAPLEATHVRLLTPSRSGWALVSDTFVNGLAR